MNRKRVARLARGPSREPPAGRIEFQSEDERGAEIARRRLAEIDADPAVLVRGEKLKARLNDILAG